MGEPDAIRNVTVIGSLDHGKSTLVDSVLAKAETGPIKVGQGSKHVGTRLNLVSLRGDISVYDEKNLNAQNADCNPVLINLIDTPGHADLFAEVTAAMSITDGTIVVIDVMDGVRVQTETVIRYALAKHVKPVILINKVDRPILESQVTKEDIYQSFLHIIDSVNAILPASPHMTMGHIQVLPDDGSVAFGARFYSWAFTVPQFAAKYAKKFGMDKKKLSERLWGDNYFNPHTRLWTKAKHYEGKPLVRAFNQFILDPIFKLHTAVVECKADELAILLENFHIKLSPADIRKEGMELLKIVMGSFMPASDALQDMIIMHLPSPATAQEYRTEVLYDGDLESVDAIGIRRCDPSAPLMIYVSKMIPALEEGTFYTFGRVFSGTATSGLPVRLYSPDYVPSSWGTNRFHGVIGKILNKSGTELTPIDKAPAGNLIVLVGVDQSLQIPALITSEAGAPAIKAVLPSTQKYIQRSVRTVNPQDMPTLVQNLRCLSKFDNDVRTETSKSGEVVVAGIGDFHLELCLEYLQKLSFGIPLVISESSVEYRETILQKSTKTSLVKSPNHRVRLYMTAEPLSEKLSSSIENGVVSPQTNLRVRASTLVKEFGWDETDARKIWAFGQGFAGGNLLVDQTRGVQFLREINGHIDSGFHWTSREGPIAEEPIRSVRFNIVDVVLMCDAIHRGAGQLMRTTRRAMYSSVLRANPVLAEPVCIVDVQGPTEAIAATHDALSRHCGRILREERLPLAPVFNIRAYLPAMEASSIKNELTPNMISMQLAFNHWQLYPGGCPLDSTTMAGKIATAIRRRKGIETNVPDINMYCDEGQ